MKIGQSPAIASPRQVKQPPGADSAAEPGVGQSGEKSAADRLVRGVVIGKAPARLRGLAVTEYLVQTDAGVLTADSFVPLDIGSELWFEAPGNSTANLVPSSSRQAMPAIMRLLLPLLAVGAENPFANAAGSTAALADYGITDKADPVKLLVFIAAINKSGAFEPISGHELDPADLSRSGDSRHITHHPEDTSTAIKNLFDAHAQLNNQAQVDPQTRNMFLFPYFFAGAAGWGEWLFSYDEPTEQGADPANQQQSISFYLMMSRLGEMHLQLTANDQGLQGVFTLPDRRAAAHINDSLGQLLPVLERLYKPVNLSCRHESVDNLQRMKDDLANKSGTAADIFTLVDISA